MVKLTNLLPDCCIAPRTSDEPATPAGAQRPSHLERPSEAPAPLAGGRAPSAGADVPRPRDANLRVGMTLPDGLKPAVLQEFKFADGSERADKKVSLPIFGPQGPKAVERFAVRGSSIEQHTDSHMHPTNYVQQGLMPKAQLKMMDEIGIRVSTLMPIPTSLQVIARDGEQRLALNPGALRRELSIEDGHAHHDCGLESYYVPRAIQLGDHTFDGRNLTMNDFRAHPQLIDKIVERSELYVDTAVNSHLARRLDQAGLTQAERSRFDPMITGLNLGDPRAGEKLLTELHMNKGTFTGIGEITVHKELVEEMYAGQRGQANTQGRANALEGLKNLAEMAGVVGLPIVLHCDVDSLRSQIADFHAGGNTGRQPDNFAGLRELFTDPRLKDTDIIWAHGGGLGRFVQQGEGHLERLEQLLHDAPKLKLDISWSQVAKQVMDGGKKDEWVAFLGKNSNRILFGSDTLAPKSTAQWNETKAMYAEVLDKLDPKARENILNGTYEQTIVAARPKVREFEQKVLTPAFYERLMDQNAPGPISAQEVRQHMQSLAAASANDASSAGRQAAAVSAGV